jgi:hypothetical protein
LAFPDPIAFAFDHRNIGMMQQSIEQRRNAGGIGEDLIPLFEGSIGCDNDTLVFVTPVDDLIE